MANDASFARIMKRHIFCLLLTASALAGCASPKPSSLAEKPDAEAIRNNSYSLLHQLFDEQKDVSILRFIRSERPDIKDLTKQIAAASKAGEQELEDFARRDASIHLDQIALPPGEVAVRDSISKTKEKELLTRKGAQFDLALLLTQTEALSYAWHLAKVTAQYEPNQERARALTDLSREMEDLYNRVFDMILDLRRRGA